MPEFEIDATGCEICAAIWQIFAPSTASRQVSRVFNYEEALDSSQCSRHIALIRSLTPNLKGLFKGATRFGATSGIQFHCPDTSLELPLITFGKFHVGLSLIHKPEITGHPGRGSIVDSAQATLDNVRTWISTCLVSHDESCRNPLQVWAMKPAWLVDIEQNCIVPGEHASAFIALSYRWGNAAPVITDSNTWTQMQSPESLQSPALRSRLGPLIRDVLYLTKELGERYVWIDTLCINHSNSQATKDQLDLMGSIYANASFTVVVVEPDAQSNILGLRDSTYPWQPAHHVVTWGKETLAIHPELVPNRWFVHMAHQYFHRGWTYQEFQLSAKRLVITQNRFHWECSRCTWHDGVNLDYPQAEITGGRPRIINMVPTLRSLNEALCDYNQCYLRYEDDALAGVSGLLAVLSRWFPGGFLYGLPIMQFDSALCWSDSRYAKMFRRSPSKRPSTEKFAQSSLPSWSWVGWWGHFGCRGPLNMYDNEGDDGLELAYSYRKALEAFPITEWYTGASSRTPPEQRHRITSSWYDMRATFKGYVEGPTPSGWSRHSIQEIGDHDVRSRAFPEGCDKFFFTHLRMPKAQFLYPFLIPEVTESTPPTIPPQMPFLFCRTDRIRLWAHIQESPEDESSASPTAVLRDRTCNDVGNLFLQHPNDALLFPNAIADDSLGQEVVVVAICQTRGQVCRGRYPETGSSGDLATTKETGEWMRVLWVDEDEDSIYYRRSSGILEMRHWNSLDRETIDLVLG